MTRRTSAGMRTSIYSQRQDARTRPCGPACPTHAHTRPNMRPGLFGTSLSRAKASAASIGRASTWGWAAEPQQLQRSAQMPLGAPLVPSQRRHTQLWSACISWDTEYPGGSTHLDAFRMVCEAAPTSGPHAVVHLRTRKVPAPCTDEQPEAGELSIHMFRPHGHKAAMH